jgi:hypothetical protein
MQNFNITAFSDKVERPSDYICPAQNQNQKIKLKQRGSPSQPHSQSLFK